MLSGQKRKRSEGDKLAGNASKRLKPTLSEADRKLQAEYDAHLASVSTLSKALRSSIRLFRRTFDKPMDQLIYGAFSNPERAKFFFNLENEGKHIFTQITRLKQDCRKIKDSINKQTLKNDQLYDKIRGSVTLPKRQQKLKNLNDYKELLEHLNGRFHELNQALIDTAEEVSDAYSQGKNIANPLTKISIDTKVLLNSFIGRALEDEELLPLLPLLQSLDAMPLNQRLPTLQQFFAKVEQEQSQQSKGMGLTR